MTAAVRRLPLAEVAPAAVLLAIAAAVLGPRPVLLAAAWLAVVTPRLIATDIAEHRLPDTIVLPAYPVVLSALLLEAWVDGTPPTAPLLGSVACGLVFLLLHAAGGMGLGDVKLAPLLGAVTGSAVPGGALVWLVLAFLLGGVGAAIAMVRRGRGTRMPFGPPMLFAAWIALLLA